MPAHAFVGPIVPETTPATGKVSAASAVGVVGVVVLLLGLSLPFDPSCAWATQTAWSVFAALAAIVAAGAGLTGGGAGRHRWLIATIAGGGLAGYWLLVVLPAVTGNPGFTLTLGAAAVLGAVWLSPHRPR